MVRHDTRFGSRGEDDALQPGSSGFKASAALTTDPLGHYTKGRQTERLYDTPY